MNVASYELSLELYELSKWEETHMWYGLSAGEYVVLSDEENAGWSCPAYDLGYLLRKAWCIGVRPADKGYKAFAWDKEAIALTPEDAAAKLAIELFKR